MSRRLLLAVPVLALMASASLADAQGAAVPPTAEPTPAKAETKIDPRTDPQTIVCKRQDATGTRLGATKVCHTRAEWAAEAMYSRQNAEHLQNSISNH
jgi:Flp pilus assembly protein CpaB